LGQLEESTVPLTLAVSKTSVAFFSLSIFYFFKKESTLDQTSSQAISTLKFMSSSKSLITW